MAGWVLRRLVQREEQMTIDPRYSVFLAMFLAAISFLAGASATLVDTGMDPVTVKHIVAWIIIFNGLGNAINAVLAAIPSRAGAGNQFWLGPKQDNK